MVKEIQANLEGEWLFNKLNISFVVANTFVQNLKNWNYLNALRQNIVFYNNIDNGGIPLCLELWGNKNPNHRKVDIETKFSFGGRMISSLFILTVHLNKSQEL